MVNIDELIFDDVNTEHFTHHNVKPEEIRQIFKREILILAAKKNRKIMIGICDSKRILSVVLDQTNGKKYYVVAARDASRKERKIYKDAMGGENKK